MPDQCDNCKWVRPRAYGTKTVLECRFSDPFVEGANAMWPIVKADDWCGRYAPEPVTTAEYPPGTVPA